ncbi:MAG: sigma-70 family RNA polymerase sigma factor, partial [Armatimonadetes bacterium]|nr:sigma-70 family RNA polymerase sigma factor [Armatimonadota bacterium]
MESRWDEMSTNELFAELRETDNPHLRNYLIKRHEGLVRHVGKAYQESAESYEDILAVGREGLINAVDRFDPNRGTKFATFAVPTIRGEIQRYFRDQTWGIHVPRR